MSLHKIPRLAIAASLCLAFGGSASLALSPSHHPPPKHSHKVPHASSIHTANVAPVIQSIPLPEELADHGAFIMSMCYDHHGVLFLGTEEQGIFSYDQRQPYKSRWHHWTTADGLGDNTCYCLCVDKKNRVFAGSNASGLAIWNGVAWRQYGQLTGPLGAHLYAMTVSPVTGDVFMATEAGIAIFGERTDTWTYLIAPSGTSLPQATALTCSKAGDLIIGTQTDGILVGRAASNFTHFDHIPGPDYMPHAAKGYGLPSGEINCLLAANGGSVIWAGTRCGLAASVDGGSTWQFWRGADYQEKIKGLYCNRPYDATVSGLELLTVPQYQKYFASPKPHGPNTQAISLPQAATAKTDAVPATWIALDAADSPTDQLGVHISVIGGDTFKRQQATIDLSKTPDPALKWLYQDERQGNFTYYFSNLAPRQTYMLRLCFSEYDFNGVGQRMFLVTANGAPALPPLDVFEKSGGQCVALSQDVPVTTDAFGTLALGFTGLHPQVYQPPSPAPSPDQMLSQDYVTTLAQGRDGKIYIGHWQNALESFNPYTQSFGPELQASGPKGAPATFVSSLLPLQSGGVLVGGYGNGLTYAGLGISSPQRMISTTQFSARTPVDVPFPTSAKPPTTQKLQQLERELAASGTLTMKPGEGAYLGASWSVRGDWIGRFGQRYTLMCAAASPFNHLFINDSEYSADGDLGPNREPDDSVRRWLQWLSSSDPRVMTDPVIGTRREAEFDDHGEDYNIQIEGPDLWITVQVPAGLHRLSAYFMNKDGHIGSNECRDYTLDLLPYRADQRSSAFLKPLAVGRVRQFWGGCYQSFAVCGPARFYLKIGRSNSFNTIVSGILLDKISGPPTRSETMHMVTPYLFAPEYGAYITPPAAEAVLNPALSASLPVKLWSDLTAASGNMSWCSAVVPIRMLCYRALAASLISGSAPVGATAPDPSKYWPPDSVPRPVVISGDDLLAWWRRSLPFVTQADRDAYADAMSRAWKDEIKLVPSLNRSDL